MIRALHLMLFTLRLVATHLKMLSFPFEPMFQVQDLSLSRQMHEEGMSTTMPMVERIP